MKSRHALASALRIFGFVFTLTVGPDSQAATEATASPYQGLANELSAKFLQGDATADSDLTAFLDKEEVVGAKFTTIVTETVKTGKKLVADGVPAKSKYFPRLLSAGATPYPVVANELAVKFLQGDATEAKDLAAFVDKEDVTGDKFKTALNTAVEAGRKLIADDVPAKSKYFPRLLAESTGAPAPGKTASATPAPAGGSPSSASKIATAAEGLWRRGLATIATLPREKRDVFLDYNLLEQTEDTASFATISPFSVKPRKAMRSVQSSPTVHDKLGLETLEDPDAVTFSDLNINSPPKFDPAWISSEVTHNPRKRADKLLVRLGFNSVIETSKSGGPAPSDDEKNAALGFGAAAVDTPPALNVDARLRNAGISFSSGFGIARAHVTHAGGPDTIDDKAVGSIMARWNLIQRKATAKWNQRVGARNADGYSLVPYFGHTEYAVHGHKVRDRPYPRGMDSDSFLDGLIFSPTFFGPFFGSGIVGEKLPEPGSTSGSTERPYLLGWSLGLSFYDEASPLIYFDVGKTVSPQHGFNESRFFYGFSFDAIVFSKIVGGTRQAAAPVVPK